MLKICFNCVSVLFISSAKIGSICLLTEALVRGTLCSAFPLPVTWKLSLTIRCRLDSTPDAIPAIDGYFSILQILSVIRLLPESE